MSEDATSACVRAAVQPEPSNTSPSVFQSAISVCKTMHFLTMSVRPFPLYKLRQGKQGLVKCSNWDLSWIKKLDSLSLDIHAMLDHSRSGRLLIEQRKECA